MRKTLIILILFYTGILYSQVPVNIDSLIDLSQKGTENDRFEVLIKISKYYSEIADDNNSLEYAMQAIKLAGEQKNEANRARAIFLQADALKYLGKVEEAEQGYKKALDIYTKLKDNNGIAEANFNLGAFYRRMKDYDAAYSYLIKVIKSKKNLNAEILAVSNRTMGGMYASIRDSQSFASSYYQAAINLYIETDNKKELADTYSDYLGAFYSTIGFYDSVVNAQQQAELLYETLGDVKKQATAIFRKGNAFLNKSNYEPAVKEFYKALPLFERINYKKGAATINNSIAVVFEKQRKFKESLDFYNKAMKSYTELDDKKELARATLNIGSILSQMISDSLISEFGEENYEEFSIKKHGIIGLTQKYEVALKKNEDALKVIEALPEDNETKAMMASIYNNIGTISFNSGKYVEALEWFNKSLNLNQEMGRLEGILTNMIGIVTSSEKMNDLETALEYVKKSEEIAKSQNLTFNLMQVYEAYHKIYKKKGNWQLALSYFVKYSAYKDTIRQSDSERARQELMTIYETEKKEQEINNLNLDKELQDTQIRQQQMAIVFFIIVFVIIIFLVIQLFRQNAARKRANKELADKNELVLQQKEEITDSIMYASRIQRAILPPDEYVHRILPSHFVLFMPRDIVSGDYYWITEKNKKVYVIAADCTGHGVPGAFMSMLGITFLNEILNEEEYMQANEVLNRLRSAIIRSLHQTGKEGENKDGMDMSLFILDRDAMEIEFAGANNSMTIISGNEIIEVKADRMPIGIHTWANESFTRKIEQVKKDDMLYVYSDGYADQFGGPDGKKFMSKRMKNLFVEISKLDMESQRKSLENATVEWRGDNFQVDDLLVIGVRV